MFNRLFLGAFLTVGAFLLWLNDESQPPPAPPPTRVVVEEPFIIQMKDPQPLRARKQEKVRCVWAQGAPEKWRHVVDTIVMVESNCNPQARGAAGELGLGQIRPQVWGSRLRGAGVIKRDTDLLQPRKNIRAVVWILEQLPGKLENKLRAYNGSGPKARKYAKRLLRQIGGGRG